MEIGFSNQIENENKYQIIINPFGESYPEENIFDYLTFEKIKKFVFTGGIYVNVAGIPFWYCHDPRDTSPVNVRNRVTAAFIRKKTIGSNSLIEQRSLFASLFPQVNYLDGNPVIDKCSQSDDSIKNFGDIESAGEKKVLKVFRAVETNTQGLIPILNVTTQA